MSKYTSLRTGPSDEKLQTFLATKSSLSTHDLTPDQITFAANYVADLASRTPRLLPREKLVMFLTYSRRQGLCKFALSYNRELDQAIRRAYQNPTDDAPLKEILKGRNDMFVELYDNEELSEKQRNHLLRILARELQTTSQLLREGRFINLEKERHLCFEKSCAQETDGEQTDPIQRIFQFHENVPEVFCVSVRGQTICYPLLEFIILLESGKIDRLPRETIATIRAKFAKEIAMYHRYQSNYDN